MIFATYKLNIYKLGFYANMGNYKGFGDSKFVPNLDEKSFEKLVMASEACVKNPGKKLSLLIVLD